MKKTLLAVCITCALALVARAGDDDKSKTEAGKKHEPAAEQKALKKEMLEKYDTNKNGKLDKEEKAKMSAEDKAKMEKAKAHASETAKKKKAV